jgi:hypothetical protein
MKHGGFAIIGLLLLSACSVGARTASFGDTQIALATSHTCDALGYVPGSAQYDQCIQNERIRQDVIARKAFNGNKNQPDGVLAQTYGKSMGLSINCTSYAMPATGSSPKLCN